VQAGREFAGCGYPDLPLVSPAATQTYLGCRAEGSAPESTGPTQPATALEAMAAYDRPVGIGTLVTVDTTIPVDINVVAPTVATATTAVPCEDAECRWAPLC
jgi:hypothetical protein